MNFAGLYNARRLNPKKRFAEIKQSENLRVCHEN